MTIITLYVYTLYILENAVFKCTSLVAFSDIKKFCNFAKMRHFECIFPKVFYLGSGTDSTGGSKKQINSHPFLYRLPQIRKMRGKSKEKKV